MIFRSVKYKWNFVVDFQLTPQALKDKLEKKKKTKNT